MLFVNVLMTLAGVSAMALPQPVEQLEKRCSHAEFLEAHQAWTVTCQADKANCPPEPQPCGAPTQDPNPGSSGTQPETNAVYSGCTSDCQGLATHQETYVSAACYPALPEYDNPKTEYLVALPIEFMNSPAIRPDWEFAPSACKKKVTVKGNGRTIEAQVADTCPGCKKPNGIDLSEGAIMALFDDLSAGVWEVNWTLQD